MLLMEQDFLQTVRSDLDQNSEDLTPGSSEREKLLLYT